MRKFLVTAGVLSLAVPVVLLWLAAIHSNPDDLWFMVGVAHFVIGAGLVSMGVMNYD